MRKLMVLSAVLVACSSSTSSPELMSPDQMLETLRRHEPTIRYERSTFTPPTVVDGPNKVMEGYLSFQGTTAKATLFQEPWMAAGECQPLDKCVTIGGWAIRPRTPSSLTSNQAAAWAKIQSAL